MRMTVASSSLKADKRNYSTATGVPGSIGVTSSKGAEVSMTNSSLSDTQLAVVVATEKKKKKERRKSNTTDGPVPSAMYCTCVDCCFGGVVGVWVTTPAS